MPPLQRNPQGIVCVRAHAYVCLLCYEIKLYILVVIDIINIHGFCFVYTVDHFITSYDIDIQINIENMFINYHFIFLWFCFIYFAR
jgi:hypothetical protein